MQLTLNGWPPVASHVICLLLGMALSQVENSPSSSQGAAPSRNKWARGKAYICLPASVIAPSYRAALKPKQALGLAKIEPQSQQPTCLMQTAVLELIQEKPNFVVRASNQTLAQIGQHLVEKVATSEQVRVFPLSAISHLPFCTLEPRVVYGAF